MFYSPEVTVSISLMLAFLQQVRHINQMKLLESLMCKFKFNLMLFSHVVAQIISSNLFYNTLPSPVLTICRWEDENIGQSWLSDTAEILDELIKEGYLSPPDQDFAPSQTAHQSRYGTY